VLTYNPDRKFGSERGEKMAVTRAGRNADAGSSTRPEARDFLNIDAHLSAEEQGVRERVRSFVDEKIRPHIKGWYDEAVFPEEIVPAFA
jgi:Acyl-CoA dehydrogenase, N-terminal domain